MLGGVGKKNQHQHQQLWCRADDWASAVCQLNYVQMVLLQPIKSALSVISAKGILFLLKRLSSHCWHWRFHVNNLFNEQNVTLSWPGGGLCINEYLCGDDKRHKYITESRNVPVTVGSRLPLLKTTLVNGNKSFGSWKDEFENKLKKLGFLDMTDCRRNYL